MFQGKYTTDNNLFNFNIVGYKHFEYMIFMDPIILDTNYLGSQNSLQPFKMKLALQVWAWLSLCVG